MEERDLLFKLKIDVMETSILFQTLRETIVFMIEKNAWILKDIDLQESYSKLAEMTQISNLQMESFTKKLNQEEDKGGFLSVIDFMDEFDVIRENIHLESAFMTNMIDYMGILNNVGEEFLSPAIVEEEIDEFFEKDELIYNQLKLNNKVLKKLREGSEN